MLSSDIQTYQSQATDETHGLANLLSSTPINPIGTTAESILIRALPAPLAAPVGWRSEIVRSNTPILANTGLNLVNTGTSFSNNNYEAFNTTNTYNTSHTGQLSSAFINNSNQYGNTSFGENLSTNNNALALDGRSVSWGANTFHERENALIGGNTWFDEHALVSGNTFHQSRTVLTEQEQKNLIHTVENQHPPPLIVRKTLPNNTVTYQQNVSIRYLQPPTPPPQGPIIIREVRPPPPPPQSPIQIRQRPPPVPTPPPLVLRERPPPIPPRMSEKVVEKLLPPLPRGPRRVIVERYGTCPPKPTDVVIERWLPYKQSGERRILLERAPEPRIPRQEPNLLILHDSPHARIRKEFINQRVIRADPNSYVQQYGAELGMWQSNPQHAHLVDEAKRTVPPPFTSTARYDRQDHGYCSDEYVRSSSPYISSNTWERARVISPIPRSLSYHDLSPYYDPPYNYCGESASTYRRDYRRSYDDCYTGRANYMTMTDVTPSWDRHCRSSSYDRYSSSYYPSFSSYPSQTIRVSSDNEFRRVLCDLTNGHVPSALHSY